MARFKGRSAQVAAVVASSATLALSGIGAAGAADLSAGRAKVSNVETYCSPMPDLGTNARRCTYTFHSTGGIDTFVVPPTTEPVLITAVGAPGAGPRGLRSRGAMVTGTFANLGGVPLLVVVGGDGRDDGFNGGGLGGGGGASDVRIGGHELQNRVIVAGGGGGSGLQLVDGDTFGTKKLVRVRGGDAGQPGLGSGGGAGTADQGGAAGGNDYAPGKPGSYGRGGSGASGYGGGGGGYYGGGGAGGCAGGDEYGPSPCVDSQPGSGGGGSSLVPANGSFGYTDDVSPVVKITVTQFGWWAKP